MVQPPDLGASARAGHPVLHYVIARTQGAGRQDAIRLHPRSAEYPTSGGGLKERARTRTNRAGVIVINDNSRIADPLRLDKAGGKGFQKKGRKSGR